MPASDGHWTTSDAGWAEGSKDKEGRLHRVDPRLGGEGEVFAAGLGSVKEVFVKLSAWIMVSILQKLTSLLKSISAGTSCISLREDPFRLTPPTFGHCPNSDWTPPSPALHQALWGTFF